MYDRPATSSLRKNDLYPYTTLLTQCNCDQRLHLPLTSLNDKELHVLYASDTLSHCEIYIASSINPLSVNVQS